MKTIFPIPFTLRKVTSNDLNQFDITKNPSQGKILFFSENLQHCCFIMMKEP